MGNLNKKMAVSDGKGGWKLRIFHNKGRGKKSPKYTVKCGCCDNSVEIYYDEFGIEINGVFASSEQWSKILKPLLEY